MNFSKSVLHRYEFPRNIDSEPASAFCTGKIIFFLCKSRKELGGCEEIMKPFVAIALIATIFLFSSCGMVWTKFPAPSGHLAIARQTYTWTDSSRKDFWNDSITPRRKLMVEVWYPAAIASRHHAPYFPGYKKLRKQLAKGEGMAIRAMRTQATEGVAVSSAQKTYPVILFSHGASVPTFYYTSQIEDMVSHGFIVMAIDHTYEGKGQSFPDGLVTQNDSEKKRPKSGTPGFEALDAKFFKDRVNVRVEDVSFVLDKLYSLNAGDTLLSGKMDIGRIGMFGHSIGGVTAAQAALKDKRIRAAVNLDGLTYARPLYPDSAGNVLMQPFMFITKPFRRMTATELAKSSKTHEQDEAELKELLNRQEVLMRKIAGGSYRVTIPGAKHTSFSDEPYLKPGNGKSKKQMTTTIRSFTLAFFNVTLNDQPDSLIGQTAKGYPGVLIERF
jgi:dienelactone hydrolase